MRPCYDSGIAFVLQISESEPVNTGSVEINSYLSDSRSMFCARAGGAQETLQMRYSVQSRCGAAYS